MRLLQIYYIGTVKLLIGTNSWDVETYWNKLGNIIFNFIKAISIFQEGRGGKAACGSKSHGPTSQVNNFVDPYLVQLILTSNFTKHEFQYHQFKELLSVSNSTVLLALFSVF